METTIQSLKQYTSDYFNLCKPKVLALMLVTAWIGMFFAKPSHDQIWKNVIFATLGIALMGAAAAVINHLVDRNIDAKMSRTHQRPIAAGRISPKKAAIFSLILGTLGFVLLLVFVNVLSALLTLLTVGGYAFFYTLFLKRATPQNIVIGGIAGAMPPLLGWAALSNSIHPHALLLVLIIFVWTPPHFWSLAIYRREDYLKANIPMLPVTHGIPFTKLAIVLYTLLLIIVTLLPFIVGMSGLLYLSVALILGAWFLIQTLRLYRSQTNQDKTALNTFSFSIIYLLLLFLAMLLDTTINIVPMHIN